MSWDTILMTVAALGLVFLFFKTGAWQFVVYFIAGMWHMIIGPIVTRYSFWVGMFVVMFLLGAWGMLTGG